MLDASSFGDRGTFDICATGVVSYDSFGGTCKDKPRRCMFERRGVVGDTAVSSLDTSRDSRKAGEGESDGWVGFEASDKERRFGESFRAASCRRGVLSRSICSSCWVKLDLPSCDLLTAGVDINSVDMAMTTRS